jgi:hypothetical protein
MKTKVLLLIGLVATLVLAGCATKPTPLKGRADLLSFLADGVTTRQEVIVRLGQPSARFEGEKILTYRLGYEPKNSGYYVVDRETNPAGWSAWKLARYSLVLVFDPVGVLKEHSVVEVN